MVSTSATVTQVAEAFALHEIATLPTSTDLDLGSIPTPQIDLPSVGPIVPTLLGILPGQGTSTVTVPLSINASLATGGSGAGAASAGRPTGGGGTQGVGPQQLVPGQVADPTQLAGLTGLDLLQQLSLLSDAAIADFIVQNPAAVSTLLGAPPSARGVHLWWSELAMDSRSAMLTAAPEVVGNLEGVPFALRDFANRRMLATTVDALRAASAATSEVGRSEAVEADHQLQMLDQITEALVSAPGEQPRTLVNFDPAGAGKASIVIGDIATADFVTFLVPGMFYTADSQMVEWAAAAQNLNATQTEWIETLAARDPRFIDATVATVAWIGYETPSLVNFTSLDLAYGGRDAIATAISGLHDSRGDDQPFVSVIAHSYGSTATMMALRDLGMQIDSLGIVGSPGSEARKATELGVPGDNVFVGEAPWDQVKDSAFFGVDPGSNAFGAHQFSVEGRVDPLTGKQLVGSTGHDEYFVRGSESLRNLALVALGQGAFVTSESPVYFKSASLHVR